MEQSVAEDSEKKKNEARLAIGKEKAKERVVFRVGDLDVKARTRLEGRDAAIFVGSGGRLRQLPQ